MASGRNAGLERLMYSPAHFAETRLEVLSELIRAQPLATLVSQCPQGLTADHIPLQWHPEPAPFGRLRGHVARANPLWREADRTTDVLAVFSGPQAYITPAWYATKAETGRVVPTWNYIAVHASGRLNVTDDPRWLRQQIEALTAQQEAGLAVPWQVDDAPNDYIDTLLRNIVGIEIIVTKLQGKWKVSQNQPAKNRAAVVHGLATSAASDSQAMAACVAERGKQTQ
jgi:transcriptional regulator